MFGFQRKPSDWNAVSGRSFGQTLLIMVFFTGSGQLGYSAPQAVMTGHVYEGAPTCQTSLCHGGASPTRGQFVSWIWSQQDYHSRSYMTLVQSRSTQIAGAMGIKNPASDSRCTACHAPLALVAPEHLASTVHADEGVSCESCHAPAGNWIRSHTRTDYTYEQRVASGMADLKNFYNRANSCVACHQNIDSELVGAGHPLLFFEMDRQSAEEPAHWEDRGEWSGPRAWLISQCVAFREVSWKLSLGGQDPNTQAQWDSLFWFFDTMNGPLGLHWETSNPPKKSTDYARWITMADALARQAEGQVWSDQQVRDCLSKLAGTSSSLGRVVGDTSEHDFYRLKRVAFAVDSLQKPLNNPVLTQAAAELVLLSKTPADFVPDKVAAALARLTASLPKAGP